MVLCGEHMVLCQKYMVLFLTQYPSKYPTSWRVFPVLTRVTMGCMVLLDEEVEFNVTIHPSSA